MTAPFSGGGGLSALVDEPYPIPDEFPDFEQVLIDLLTPMAYVCTTLPESADLMQQALPLFWVRRVGGGLDADGITDTAHMQVMAFSYTRRLSEQLSRQARRAILESPGTSINGVLLDWAEEITGLIEMADIDPLNRTVEIAFAIDARRQYP